MLRSSIEIPVIARPLGITYQKDKLIAYFKKDDTSAVTFLTLLQKILQLNSLSSQQEPHSGHSGEEIKSTYSFSLCKLVTLSNIKNALDLLNVWTYPLGVNAFQNELTVDAYNNENTISLFYKDKTIANIVSDMIENKIGKDAANYQLVNGNTGQEYCVTINITKLESHTHVNFINTLLATLLVKDQYEQCKKLINKKTEILNQASDQYNKKCNVM